MAKDVFGKELATDEEIKAAITTLRKFGGHKFGGRHSFKFTDEQLAFIKETAHELETQDNRHTATPIYRIYEEIKVEKRDGNGDHLERLDYEGAEDHYCGHCRSILKANDGDQEKLPPIGENDCYCDVEDDAHWTYDVELLPAQGGYDGVAFITEKAAQQYLEANHYHFNKGVVYAESAFRNWELQGIIELIKSMGSDLQEESA